MLALTKKFRSGIFTLISTLRASERVKRRKTSAIFQYEAIRPLEPSASVRRNAVHDLGCSHNAAGLKLCGIQPVVDAKLLVDLQGSMDEYRPSVIGGPAAFLDVFGTASDQVRPRLADRKNFHGSVLRHVTGCSRSAMCIVQFTSQGKLAGGV